MPLPQESWSLSKAPRTSREGIIVAQHALAAAAGAEILAQGGNAADAAVAAAFALGVVEPWMSGIGGGGYLLYGDAARRTVKAVDFGMTAGREIDPARYPLAGGTGVSAFGWPRVEGDRNLKGYESICVPGAVDGLGLALETFGRKPLAEAIEPALRLAAEGLPLDWHTTLAVAVAARELAEFPTSRAIYLPDGLPPVPPPDGAPARLVLGNLAATYRRLAEAGRRDFYEGALTQTILDDLHDGGSRLTAADFSAYRARILEPLTLAYRGVDLHVAPELNGGPTFLEIMAELDGRLPGGPSGFPDAQAFLIYAEAIRRAFTRRLGEMGQKAPTSNTTHIAVVDRDGNMASLTNTLLARFGSKVVLPQTGIAMNNGMMWFDPMPGRPNSIGPGKKPLANMCPILITRDGAPWAALGACGGRRIISAMVQLTSFLVDFDMPLEKAFGMPRIDASGELVLCDKRFPPEVLASLDERLPIELVEETVYPTPFSVPSAVMRGRSTGLNSGMAHIHSPVAAALVARAP